MIGKFKKVNPSVPDGLFYARLIKNGWLQWSVRTEKGSVSPPFINDQTAFFGSADGIVNAVDLETAKIEWEIDNRHQVSGSPICWRNSVITGNSAGSLLYFPLNTSDLLWEFPSKAAITGASVVTGDIIYFKSSDRNLYALMSVD